MTKIPTHVRARIMALGAMSRPLGEERAVAVALELAQGVVNEIRNGDPERIIYAYEMRIRREIAAKQCRDAAARGSRPSAISLRDLLPEIPCTGLAGRG